MRVFLSYSDANRALAEELKRALRSQRVGTWFDREGLGEGEDWKQDLDDALRKADAIVFLVDRNFLKSEFGPQHEVSAALESAWKDPRKRLIPVLIGDAQLPPFLRDRTPVRIATRPRKLAPAIKSIVDALQGNAGLADEASLERERARRRNRLREIKSEAVSLRG